MSTRYALMTGALLAAIGVALGAYGAHGLEQQLVALGFTAELPQRLDWFETGVKYQLYHALAIVALAGRWQARWSGFAFLLGIALFSGSLYAMTFLSADWKKLGAVVPLGGLSLILGWGMLAVNAWRCDAGCDTGQVSKSPTNS